MCVRRKIFSHLDRRTRTKTLIYFNFFLPKAGAVSVLPAYFGKTRDSAEMYRCVVGRFFSTPTKDRRFLHVCLRTAFPPSFFPVKKEKKSIIKRVFGRALLSLLFFSLSS